MKLSPEEKAELMDGLLPLLDETATFHPKKPDVILKVPGRDLINLHGITKDANGNQILPGVIYDRNITEPHQVNHRQNIGKIIAEARTREAMESDLAAYLTKYSKENRKQVLDNSPLN